MLFQRVRCMVGVAWYIDEAEGVAWHEPRVDEECFSRIFQAVGCVSYLCYFHNIWYLLLLLPLFLMGSL